MAGAKIQQPNIYLTFPNGGGEMLLPNHSITVDMERIASVIPLPGNTSSGLPRLFWVDLGLTNYNLIIQGTFKDAQLGGTINPFSITDLFMQSWSNDMINITSNTDVNDLTRLRIDDPTWGQLNYYCLNSKIDLIRGGGRVQWDYYMRFSVVVPPDINVYSSLNALDPITGYGPSVHVGFPVVGRQATIQTDGVTINYDRMANTIPLPGNSDQRRPQFAYTDLGLAQPVMILDCKFPDIVEPNPFEVMEAFYRNWSGRIAGDSRTNSNVEGLLGICLDDPRGSRAFFGVPQHMSLTRFGGTSSWVGKLSMWIARADGSGV